MTRQQIYNEIRARSPLGKGSDPELLEALEAFKNEDLLEDLEDLYQEWGSLPKIYCTDKEEDIEHIQQCESLFDFITQAIFNHGDPSVIPRLLKYVPSDDDDKEDSVFMEDYSSEQLCNGITDSDYFGEDYIPVLLGCIHELLPRAMANAESFFYQMILDDLGKFSDTHPLIGNLYLAQKESLMQIFDYSVEKALNELQEESGQDAVSAALRRISYPIASVVYEDEPIDKKAFFRQEFLKLHGHDG
ncbi:hypothetical protein [Holospora curviuscula]|uniref:Uncharacterized protein n=1 Tax=Holospora curviuscula TaxID=1082868 RepID=A0A2S5RAF8_9PROT|nr:hypothetical protein [Holospora curviuscula]PPE04298.1 hypothetical protein HCUR_00489 [Holospora curviuscula]